MFRYTLPLTQDEKFDALIADLKRPLKRARSILGTADVYGLGLDHGSKLVVVVMFITSPIRAVAKVIDAILGLMLSEDNLFKSGVETVGQIFCSFDFACIDSAMMLAVASLKIVHICLKLVMLIKDLANHLLFFISAILSFVTSTLPNVIELVIAVPMSFSWIIGNTHFLATLGVFLLYSNAYVGALVAEVAFSIVLVSEIWSLYGEVCYDKSPDYEVIESKSLLMLIACVIVVVLSEVYGLLSSTFSPLMEFLNVSRKMIISLMNHLFFFSRLMDYNEFHYQLCFHDVDLRTDWKHADGCLGLSCGVASDVLFEPVKAVYRVMLPTNEAQPHGLHDKSDVGQVNYNAWYNH